MLHMCKLVSKKNTDGTIILVVGFCEITARVKTSYSFMHTRYRGHHLLRQWANGSIIRKIRLFERNSAFSLILILAALDNLPNLLLFLAGILFIILVTTSSSITHTLSAAPSRHYPVPAVTTHTRPSPAVSLILVDTLPAVFPNTCPLCSPRHFYLHLIF